ncbi:hypothetical protein GIB67_031715 [Kingdonia uniflora]|uniref:Uncharacterized protein n=1 Tax=Kingdonia uniflora TaxID=39325 RepID=A0A7J7NKM7_9MAGN|nr:hypothetical protein GIB67_031715 [Kingdonia uniflora]
MGTRFVTIPPPRGVVRISVACQQYLSNTSVEQLYFVLDLYVYFGRVSEKLAKLERVTNKREENPWGEGQWRRFLVIQQIFAPSFCILGPDGGPGEGLSKGLKNLSAGPLSKLVRTSLIIEEDHEENESSENGGSSLVLGLRKDT